MSRSQHCRLAPALLLLLLTPPLASCALCGGEVLDRYPAPDNSVEVVVFQRDCGATTPFSTQASIGEINAGTGNRPGNIFVATTDHGNAPAGKGGGPELRVRWLDTRTVELAHHRAADVWTRTEYRGVQIRYVTFE